MYREVNMSNNNQDNGNIVGQSETPNVNNQTQQNNNRNNQNNTRTNQSSEPFNWEGLNSNIGSVVGLKREKFKLKSTFGEFQEKVLNYVTTNYDRGTDLHDAII